MEENGVKRIETTGKRFDPNVHEAVAAENTPDIEEDMILEELRPGYMLNDRLLRPAQVKVAKNEEKDTGQYEIDEEDND